MYMLWCSQLAQPPQQPAIRSELLAMCNRFISVQRNVSVNCHTIMCLCICIQSNFRPLTNLEVHEHGTMQHCNGNSAVADAVPQLPKSKACLTSISMSARMLYVQVTSMCPEYLLLLHAGFVLTTVEAIGDITATEEASALATFGDKHNKRVQGGLLGDGEHPCLPCTVNSLCNDCFGYQNICPYIELSLLRGTTAVRMQ